MVLIHPSTVKRHIRVMAIASVFWLTLPIHAAIANMEVQDGAPEGFEQLQAPRPTRVTLLYGGDVLGSFAAHFAPGTLQFDKPQEIIDAIPTISDPVKILAVLRNAMPTHVDRLCTAKHLEGCGMLQPAIAGLIFDENRLTAELFINKDYLSVTDDRDAHYLPLPERHFSSVDAINGAITGTDGTSPTYAVSNNATYSYGEGKINTQSTLSNQGLRFDTAAADIERQGWNATGGLFRSRPMELLGDRDIGGFSVATSGNTLLDEYKTSGNDIILYLPRRSFVSILREGRIYSSRTYEAGNQHIDTSELPEGAYEITLRIQEADGQIREEKRFFAKTQDIPSPDRPIYYAQAGLIRKTASSDSTIPQLTGNPILRTGTVRRIDDNLGLSISALGVKDRALFETGLFWLGNGTQINATALTSTHGDMGVQASYIQNVGNFSAAIDARKLWMSDSPIAGYEDLSQKITQATATLAYAFDNDMSLGLRASYSQQSGSTTAISAGPYAQWRIWQEGEDSLEASADAARTGQQYQGSAFLHFTHHMGAYGITTTGGATVAGGDRSPVGSARVWHDDQTPGDALLVGAGVSGDKRNQIASTDADWRNTVGQVRGSVQEAFGQGNSTFGYGGNFAFNIAQLADEIHVGGQQTDKSAIIVETEGDADTTMKIFVNGAQQSIVKVGDQQVVYLTPFHMYNVRIVPETPSLLDYDSSEHKVTLYPGNVAKLQWKVNKFYVVTAKITTPDGKPLANAILQETRAQVTTDSQGRLQAELSKPAILTFTQDENTSCAVRLPQMKAVNGVLIYRKALTCQPVIQSASR